MDAPFGCECVTMGSASTAILWCAGAAMDIGVCRACVSALKRSEPSSKSGVN